VTEQSVAASTALSFYRRRALCRHSPTFVRRLDIVPRRAAWWRDAAVQRTVHEPATQHRRGTMVARHHAVGRALAVALFASMGGCVHRAPSTSVLSPSLLTLGDGVRIRVTAPAYAASPRIGHFIAVRTDTLSMWRDVSLDSLAVPLSAIRGVEMSTWRGSYMKQGVIVGVLVGALGGGLLSPTQADSCTGYCSSYGSRGRGRTLGFFVGGLVGAAAGAGVGYFTSRERWSPVALPGTGAH
jgi:hypothetical protein